ncbi:2,3-diaminopropionate biosynthesis protein SbnA [Actinokineospora bangkokensis]|uniref:2,3-diaminopropionate biosynthesis protein SbnA n=1 Tax=Actinokineospora bangkokensis TaxID=1193682 RepID=A0A1Q9LPI7_9PSEU|nr:2,3-diaminopropionate biosynthesis protein SbnA [Actinokineospora bangkokensis]
MGPLASGLARIGGAMRETALVPLRHGAVDLHAKLEYANPNGSSKDRSAFWILKRAVERGDVTERTTVVESSSGNFALSMASFCRVLGIDFVPVIDPNCNASTEAYLRLTCDRVEKVTERDATGGYLATRLRRVAALRAELPAAFWPDQYGNADAVEAHYLLTGGELVRAFDRIDYAFIGAGTGGTIGGVSLRLKEAYPGVRVVAVDAEGSAIFGGAPKTRRIPGLGSSMVPPLIGKALIDEVLIVSEPDTVRGCHDLLREHGLYAGGSTGTVYSALTRYFADLPAGGAGPRPTAVFLCADRGTAYADTIYNPAWAATLLDPAPA